MFGLLWEYFVVVVGIDWKGILLIIVGIGFGLCWVGVVGWLWVEYCVIVL